jgi:hypothetical protein
MKLISFKKTGPKTYDLDGNPFFIAGLFIFLFFVLVTSLVTWSLFAGFIIAIALTVIIMPIVLISERLGKKKHLAIHKSRLFQELYNAGFKEEKFGEYLGLTRTDNGRTIRIYYDWNKLAESNFSNGDIVINVFYMPLTTKLDTDEIDSDRITELNKKFKISRWNVSKRFFRADRVIVHFNYYRWTKLKKINDAIEKVIIILNQENLKPFDIKKISNEFHNYKKNEWYLPYFELVHDEIEKRGEGK